MQLMSWDVYFCDITNRYHFGKNASQHSVHLGLYIWLYNPTITSLKIGMKITQYPYVNLVEFLIRNRYIIVYIHRVREDIVMMGERLDLGRIWLVCRVGDRGKNSC